MKNKAMEIRIADELMAFITHRRTLLLSTVDENNHPYASYAPYAIGLDCIYVLISDIAMQFDRKLEWDNEKEMFVNDDEANALLQRTQRKPYGTNYVKA